MASKTSKKDRSTYSQVAYFVFLFFAIPSHTWLMLTVVVHHSTFMVSSVGSRVRNGGASGPQVLTLVIPNCTAMFGNIPKRSPTA